MSSPTEWIVAAIAHAQPTAYARCSVNRITVNAFAEALIHGALSPDAREGDEAHASGYDATPVEWGDLHTDGNPDARHRWTAWGIGGRTVAWTRDDADAPTIGPTLRFGLVGRRAPPAPYLVIVSRDDTQRRDVDSVTLAAARMFAQILEAQGLAPTEATT